MKHMLFFVVIALICIGALGLGGAQAQIDREFAVQIVADTIDVSVGFNGSAIELFGDRRNLKGDVVIVVEGPRKDITIWKKERIMGAWVNRYYMTFKEMPVYYNYASTSEIIGKKDKALNKIAQGNGIGHAALFSSLGVKKSKSIKDPFVFQNALLERKQKRGVYFDKPADITFINDYLFRVRFEVPPSAQTGEYKIRGLLIEDGKVTHKTLDTLMVRQVGINAFIYNMARNNSFPYALMTIVLALFCGWFVSVVKVRP